MNSKLDEALLELCTVPFLNSTLVEAAASRKKVKKIMTVLSIQYELDLLSTIIECEEE